MIDPNFCWAPFLIVLRIYTWFYAQRSLLEIFWDFTCGTGDRTQVGHSQNYCPIFATHEFYCDQPLGSLWSSLPPFILVFGHSHSRIIMENIILKMIIYDSHRNALLFANRLWDLGEISFNFVANNKKLGDKIPGVKTFSQLSALIHQCELEHPQRRDSLISGSP